MQLSLGSAGLMVVYSLFSKCRIYQLIGAGIFAGTLAFVLSIYAWVIILYNCCNHFSGELIHRCSYSRSAVFDTDEQRRVADHIAPVGLWPAGQLLRRCCWSVAGRTRQATGGHTGPGGRSPGARSSRPAPGSCRARQGGCCARWR